MATTTTVTTTNLQSPAATQAGRYVLRAFVIFGVLLVWHLFAHTPLGRVGDLPTPLSVFARLMELMGTGAYWGAIGSTLTTWGLGLLISFLVGVPLGLFIGSNTRVEVSTRLVIDFLRTIPSIAFLPLALLLYGVDIRTPLLLVFFAAVWPQLIQATYAAKQIDPTLKNVRRSFHLSWSQYIFYQFTPSALPFVTTGLRIAATVCLLTAMSVELLSGAPGVGSQLQAALAVSQTPTLYAYVITAGILGVLINGLLLMLQRGLIWWHPSIREDAR